MYVVDTTILDEVELIVEKCSQHLRAAIIAIDSIDNYQTNEIETLNLFNSGIDEFINYTFRLFDINGDGDGSGISHLYREVRKNILNIQSSDQVHTYMQGAVFGVGENVLMAQKLIDKAYTALGYPFDEVCQRQKELQEELAEKLQKEVQHNLENGINNSSNEIMTESEQDMLLIMAISLFLEFFKTLELLSIALERLNAVTERFNPVAIEETCCDGLILTYEVVH